MSEYVDEIVGGDGIRRYNLVNDDGTNALSSVQIVKAYTPEQAGSPWGAADINALNSALQIIENNVPTIAWTTEEITTSQTWTVPDNVTEIYIMLFGGGSAGSTYALENYQYNGGGGSGGKMASGLFSVTPGSQYAITIGAGGAQTVNNAGSSLGGSGGATSFGALLTALGGEPGTYASSGGNGGSGGGRGYSPTGSQNVGGYGTVFGAGGGGASAGVFGGSTLSTSDAAGMFSGVPVGTIIACILGDATYANYNSTGDVTNNAFGGFGGNGAARATKGGGGGFMANGGDGTALSGGGGGGMLGGHGGAGAAGNFAGTQHGGGGGGGGYGPLKLAGDGYPDGGKGGFGYGAGGGGSGYGAVHSGAGAPGICIIKYRKAVQL